ncbi:hypothetical protein X801_06911, partial [Opisthorchis viverrini]
MQGHTSSSDTLLADEGDTLLLNPYDVLKDALIKKTAATDEQNLRVLLAGVELGDRTPAQLLRHMTQIQGKQAVNESILKELWLQILPGDIRKVLSVVDKDTTLPKLAELADQVFSCYGTKPSPSVQSVVMNSNTQTDFEALKQQVLKLSLQISRISAKLTHHSRSNSCSHPKRSRSFFNRDESTWICRYHRKFGSKA